MGIAKNSATKIKANAKYTAKTYDQFLVYVPKGKKVNLQAHAQTKGEGLNTDIAPRGQVYKGRQP